MRFLVVSLVWNDTRHSHAQGRCGPIEGGYPVTNRRLIIYLILGGILCFAGVFTMLYGMLKNNMTSQLTGVIMYAASIPLLFQAKLTRMSGRISTLEKRLGKTLAGQRASGRHGRGEHDEEEEGDR